MHCLHLETFFVSLYLKSKKLTKRLYEHLGHILRLDDLGTQIGNVISLLVMTASELKTIKEANSLVPFSFD